MVRDWEGNEANYDANVRGERKRGERKCIAKYRAQVPLYALPLANLLFNAIVISFDSVCVYVGAYTTAFFLPFQLAGNANLTE